jgi:ribosomal protein L16/L10AE
MKFFKKKHLVIFNNKSNFICPLIQGSFGIYFSNFGLINFFQYKALIFFLKKKLKYISKIFIRISKSLYCTKKSIGVRMGKGKGSVDNLYIPVKKGQIFLEFFFKKKSKLLKNIEFLKKIKKIIILLSKKLGIKINLIQY